jgi:integrase
VLEDHQDQWSIDGHDGLVFPNQGGRPLGASSWRTNVFVPACGKAGLATALLDTKGDPVKPARWVDAPRIHDLRHTAAALMVLAGAHPKAMQVRMGHSSIRTTLGRYGHLYPEMDEQLAANLGDIRAAVA